MNSSLYHLGYLITKKYIFYLEKRSVPRFIPRLEYKQDYKTSRKKQQQKDKTRTGELKRTTRPNQKKRKLIILTNVLAFDIDSLQLDKKILSELKYNTFLYIYCLLSDGTF